MARILVVEDDATLRQLCAESLGMLLGHEVVEAADGIEALEHLERARPGAVVLDLQLPRLNGYEVLRHIRRSMPSVPVVVISGTATGRWSLREGANAYLSKPFDLYQLEDAVRRAMH